VGVADVGEHRIHRAEPASIEIAAGRGLLTTLELADAILTAVYDDRLPGNECSVVASQK
jgi:hypothetical protein